MKLPEADVRAAFKCLYGSWAGTLVGAGRSDEDIERLLRSSEPALNHMTSRVAPIAAAALEAIVAHLPALRLDVESKLKAFGFSPNATPSANQPPAEQATAKE